MHLLQAPSRALKTALRPPYVSITQQQGGPRLQSIALSSTLKPQSPFPGAMGSFDSPASAGGSARRAAPSQGGVDGSAYTGGPSLSPLIQQRFDDPSVTQALPPQSVRELNRIGANDYMSHNIIWNQAHQQALNDPNLHVIGPTRRATRSSAREDGRSFR